MQPAAGFWGSTAFHENVEMPLKDFPIKFFDYTHGSPGPYCPLHWHEQLEMIFVLEGLMETTVQTSTFVSGQDEIILINSNEYHSYALVSTPIHVFVVLMDISLLQGRFLTSGESRLLTPIANSKLLFYNNIKGDIQLKTHFIALMEEHLSREPGYEFAIKSAVYGIVTRLVRQYINRGITGSETTAHDKNIVNINNIIKYIEANYSEALDLTIMADTMGYTKYYFCRFFKEMTGFSPINYLNRYRINKAAMSLAVSSSPITDIAMACGFNDPNYFTRVFKGLMGYSPSQYRDREKQQNK